MWLLVAQRIFLEAILDILYFPLWWYAGGAKRALLWCVEVFSSGNRTLAPGLWLSNIFVPMYGQYDIEGRIISFFMRLAQIIARAAALLVWFLFSVLLFLAWLAFPFLVGMGFYSVFIK